MKFLIKHIFPSSCHFLRVKSNYILHHPILEHLQPIPSTWKAKFHTHMQHLVQ
jgi:hypothetical protein